MHVGASAVGGCSCAPLTLPPRAPLTHAASAPCTAGACAPRKGMCIRSALFVTRDDGRAQQQHNARGPPPPAAERSMSECTAATAKRRTQLKSGFSFHKLEAATLATPGNTLSCVQHFTFLNKSAKQNQISCSTEQRCNSGNRCRRSIKKITCNEFSARVGREWSVAQRVATHGPVLHRRIRSAVGNSKAVFTLFLFHLPYITRQHHTHGDRATLHKRSPDTRKTWSCPRPLCAFSRT